MLQLVKTGQLWQWWKIVDITTKDNQEQLPFLETMWLIPFLTMASTNEKSTKHDNKQKLTIQPC